jgi:hypothetical protein
MFSAVLVNRQSPDALMTTPVLQQEHHSRCSGLQQQLINLATLPHPYAEDREN